MFQYSMFEWLAFFYFYCFLGWCFESTFVSLKKKKLVNRGFVRGPFLPLYGFGAIMMLLVSAEFQDNLILTFFAGCICATLLEYITGVLMEAIFKVRYWDYSNQKFNFQGQICLTSTIAWGFLTILMTRIIHKFIADIILSIARSFLVVGVIIITFLITIDIILSVKAALELKDILMRAEQIKNDLIKEVGHLQKRVDVVIAVIEDATMEKRQEISTKVTERFEKWAFYTKESKEKMNSIVKKFYRRSMLKNNPMLSSRFFTENLNALKEMISLGIRKIDTDEISDQNDEVKYTDNDDANQQDNMRG